MSLLSQNLKKKSQLFLDFNHTISQGRQQTMPRLLRHFIVVNRFMQNWVNDFLVRCTLLRALQISVLASHLGHFDNPTLFTNPLRKFVKQAHPQNHREFAPLYAAKPARFTSSFTNPRRPSFTITNRLCDCCVESCGGCPGTLGGAQT